ncbi:tyrosine-protein phosphatase [Flagellimonas iocasae]|uniref:protein-tyrosine-phosphatase n=1 Tax=Flagellimonas iocasae TaxID=2055905 RepID=A0ABW4XX70_9FLAO
MFSFFEKKVFLADYLHGLVDIHNHILPGIDDGAKTVDDSIGLLKGFSEIGVTNFVCTPHIMHNYYENTPSTIKDAYQKLEAKLAKDSNYPDLTLDYAAEHMIDDNFEELLENKKVMGLKKEYLLIEMSYLQPSFNFEMAVDKIAHHNYFPILAHPERYMYFHQKYKKYNEMKTDGILFQLNLLSLSSESYGTNVQKIAEKLLAENLIDYVGSDVHNLRQLNLIKEIKLSTKVLNRLLPVIENTIQTFY